MGERDGFYGPGLLAAFVNGDGPIDYHTSVPCDVGDGKGCGLGRVVWCDVVWCGVM